MKKAKKYFHWIFIIAFPVFFCQHASAQLSLDLIVKNNSYKQAYFCSITGSKMNVLAGEKVHGDTIAFKFKSNLIPGVYRIYISDSVFIDYIIARDINIRMRTVNGSFSDSLKVISGNDNIRYYKYMTYRNAELKKLSRLSVKIKPADSRKVEPLLDERISFLQGCVTYEINEFAKNLIGTDTASFVSKLIKAQIVPNVNLELLENPDGKFYNNDVEFLLVHFFDNIDFADTNFLRTEIFYRTIKYYIEKLVLPRNVTGFNYANEFILKKAAASQKVYRYILSDLFDLYEYSQLEDVYLKLYENYLLKDTLAVTSARFAQIKHKIGIIKSLSPGNTAPDIAGKDTLGNEIKLSSLNSKIIMLFIWKPGDKHSEDAMLQLGDLYEKYKDYGLEVFAFALDSSETDLKESVRSLKKGWINVSDMKGMDSPVCGLYNTWSLPGIYFMDDKRKITAKPMNMDYVKKEFEKLDKK